MPATPARRAPSARQFNPQPQPSRTALDRRRRSQHFARRRRDLLEDTAAALLVTLLTITLTAGLGVVALIELPIVLVLISTYLLDHRRRSRAAVSGRLATRLRADRRHFHEWRKR